MDQAEPLNVLRTPDLDFIEQTTILPNKLYSNNRFFSLVFECLMILYHLSRLKPAAN